MLATSLYRSPRLWTLAYIKLQDMFTSHLQAHLLKINRTPPEGATPSKYIPIIPFYFVVDGLRVHTIAVRAPNTFGKAMLILVSFNKSQITSPLIDWCDDVERWR